MDQEFPDKARSWLGERMPGLLHEFVTTPEVKGAVGGIFLSMSTNHLLPHWAKWLRANALDAIYDVARGHLAERHPHLFNDD